MESAKPPVIQPLAPASENPLDALGSVTPDQMSADLAAATPKATAPTNPDPSNPTSTTPTDATPDAGRWAALRDKFGNPFDPKVHLTKGDNVPALSRAGNLMARPGMAPTLKARAEGLKGGVAPAAEGSRTTLHLAEENEPEEDDDDDDELEEAAPELSKEEREKRAAMDAETTAELESLGLELLGLAELDPEERARLEKSAKRVMLQDNIELPFGAKTLHSMELFRVFKKKAGTPEGAAALQRTDAFIQNLVNKVKGGKP